MPAIQPSSGIYRGRFAPSPTGALHFGSLIAAVASYLQARRAAGKWLVRIEDLDQPRAVPGSAELILRTLEAYGFEWDEQVIYQSARTEVYEQALKQLRDQGLAYACSCTRSQLQSLTNRDLGDGEELHYPGICRNGPQTTQPPFAWRFRVPDAPITFSDLLQGTHCVDLNQSIGDFVVKRRDGWFAYQLAVVVDDAVQGITEVVRGADLLFNTPRQIALQRALGFSTPSYMHVPLATDGAGHKLSKSSSAPAVTEEQPITTLWRALDFLKQEPPPALIKASLSSLWSWAFEHWQPTPLIGLRSAVATT